MLRLLHSKSGHTIISIILGFGLACLFRRICKDRECIIYTAPDFKKIKDQIFRFDENVINTLNQQQNVMINQLNNCVKKIKKNKEEII